MHYFHFHCAGRLLNKSVGHNVEFVHEDVPSRQREECKEAGQPEGTEMGTEKTLRADQAELYQLKTGGCLQERKAIVMMKNAG